MRSSHFLKSVSIGWSAVWAVGDLSSLTYPASSIFVLNHYSDLRAQKLLHNPPSTRYYHLFLLSELISFRQQHHYNRHQILNRFIGFERFNLWLDISHIKISEVLRCLLSNPIHHVFIRCAFFYWYRTYPSFCWEMPKYTALTVDLLNGTWHHLLAVWISLYVLFIAICGGMTVIESLVAWSEMSDQLPLPKSSASNEKFIAT